jgi:hypothetical protein
VSGDHPKELVVFLSEFFHPDHGSNITDVVIFGYSPPSPLIIPKLGPQPQGNVMEYVQIQPGEYAELSRSRADRANAVFILNSSATYESPRELDSRASLYMVLVKQCVTLYPPPPCCASAPLTLLQVSQEHVSSRCARARAAAVERKRTGAAVYDELHVRYVRASVCFVVLCNDF